jgi:hypothetical protein
MATEVTFAKTFFSLLDSKTPKISPDHVEDPRSYPGSIPVRFSPSIPTLSLCFSAVQANHPTNRLFPDM